MFDKGKTEGNEEKFFGLYKDVANQLRATGISYSKGDEFYREYTDFISKLTTTFENLQNFCQQQSTSYARTQDEARQKSKKDGDFSKDSEEFIKTKTDELIKKNKHLDELRGKMKESLGKLEAKKIAKLKVKETANLNNMFTTIYQIFYKDAKTPFDWSSFKKNAVTKDNLEDFQNRLVNLDFSTLTQGDIQSLATLKDDPWIKDYVVSNKEGGALLELVNYLEFVRDAVATQSEIHDLQEKIQRIKTDAPKRSEQAKIEANAAEVLTENIKHLDAINHRMVKSAEPFAEEVKRTDEMFHSYEQHRNRLREVINHEYPRIQSVPQSLYKASGI